MTTDKRKRLFQVTEEDFKNIPNHRIMVNMNLGVSK